MIRTAECITPHHPDKICDRISDAILDECLFQDPNSRVAVETMGGHRKIVVMGEITTNAEVDFERVVRNVYSDVDEVDIHIVKQSNLISQGVDTGGAGDQGIMVGYACNENYALIPHELYLARQLCRRIHKEFPFDGKTQVTLDQGKVTAIVASFQNASSVALRQIIGEWLASLDEGSVTAGTEIHANPAGDWEVGGFDADTGLTGRKLVVDNYGPRVPIGGGAFSGKDPSKVDRSAAYMARWIAVDYLRTHHAAEVYVYLAYAIGHPAPVQATAIVDGTPYEVTEYDLTPKGIADLLELKQPQYRQTAEWGHFGNGFVWG
jgi:S-adenosylmethionine synthetase